MALSVAHGTFSPNTSTGNQAITGVGFQPEVIIFICSNLTGTGTEAQAKFGFSAWRGGAADHRTIAVAARDGIATTETTGYTSTGRAPALITVSDYEFLGTAGSFDADGFTINWLVTSNPSGRVSYIALAGTDLTNTALGTYGYSTGTGNNSVTGLGFQPDVLFMFTCVSATDHSAYNAGGDLNYAIGMATGTSNQGCTNLWSDHGNVTATVANMQLSDCVHFMQDGTSVTDKAVFVSFDAGGFTVNRTVNSGSKQAFYLAMAAGGKVQVGTETSATSVTTKSTTGLSFVPKLLLLNSINSTTTTGVVETGNFTTGMGISSSSSSCYTGLMQDNVADTVTDTYWDEGNIILLADAGTPTITDTGDISTFDSTGGFTLNWTVASGSAKEFIYLTIGDTDASAGGATLIIRDLIMSGMIAYPR